MGAHITQSCWSIAQLTRAVAAMVSCCDNGAIRVLVCFQSSAVPHQYAGYPCTYCVNASKSMLLGPNNPEPAAAADTQRAAVAAGCCTTCCTCYILPATHLPCLVSSCLSTWLHCLPGSCQQTRPPSAGASWPKTLWQVRRGWGAEFRAGTAATAAASEVGPAASIQLSCLHL